MTAFGIFVMLCAAAYLGWQHRPISSYDHLTDREFFAGVIFATGAVFACAGLLTWIWQVMP
jgi:hypothetical protein